MQQLTLAHSRVWTVCLHVNDSNFREKMRQLQLDGSYIEDWRKWNHFLLKRMTVIHNIYINPVWGKYISLLLKALNKKHGVISHFF